MIIIPGTNTNPLNPYAQPPKGRLLANPLLTHWYQSAADSVTQSAGVVSAFRSLKNDGKTATKEFTGSSAVLAAKAAIGGYEAADVSGATGAYAYKLSALPDLTGAWSMAFVVGALAPNAGASQTIFDARPVGVSTTNACRVLVAQNASLLVFQAFYGNQGLNITTGADALTSTTGGLLLVSFSGGVLRGKWATQPLRTLTPVGTYDPTNGVARLMGDSVGGSALKGWLADALILPGVDFLAAGNESLLATVKSYVGTYGLTA